MTEDQISSTHPQLPPTTEETLFSCLRLLRSRRVGNATYHRLLKEHGTADTALDALPDIAKAAGTNNYQICPEGVVQAELRAGKLAGATLVAIGSPQYPRDLTDISDAPPLLWAIGDLALLQQPLIALVGARNASSLGTRMARSLASGLGQAGLTTVSGLARGIDAAVHAASLDTGTIAVCAGGVDVVYPAENTDLTHEIGRRGLRISEQPMGVVPQARHFPPRNRIISGMSRAVVVIEAAARSGSLITARNALDQGRDVLAVPGHPFDARASGCNMLIRDGATLVRGADDVLEEIGPLILHSEVTPLPPAQPDQNELPLVAPKPSSQKRSLRETAALHTQILNRLGPAPVAEDQLIRDLGHAAKQVTPILVDLELEGQIIRQAGGMLSRP